MRRLVVVVLVACGAPPSRPLPSNNLSTETAGSYDVALVVPVDTWIVLIGDFTMMGGPLVTPGLTAAAWQQDLVASNPSFAAAPPTIVRDGLELHGMSKGDRVAPFAMWYRTFGDAAITCSSARDGDRDTCFDIQRRGSELAIPLHVGAAQLELEIETSADNARWMKITLQRAAGKVVCRGETDGDPSVLERERKLCRALRPVR